MKKINVLADYFQSSSDACPLEVGAAEELEQAFQAWFDEQMQDFEFAARFMMCHLGNPEKYHPHCTAIITVATAEVMEGKRSVGIIEDYIPD